MNKKGMAWGYIVGLILSLVVLLILLYIAFRSKGQIFSLADFIRGIFT
ncbi:hypothetical protein J4401_00460 [Candidatus Woesearchaeota archaeon]|nr:hypothetical protein [Candidatus Woesearchaeota archaeon]